MKASEADLTELEKLKVYGYWGSGYNEPPSNLLTKNQLREKRLKLAPGQEPAGGIWIYKRDGYLYLYDENQAVPMPPLSEKQKAGAEKARLTKRTCTSCRVVVNWGEIPLRRRDNARLCESCLEKERRQPLSDQAKTLLTDPNIVVLDTETTGLDDPHIIQIAVIDSQETTLLNTLVRLAPGAVITAGATVVHGITGADLEAAPTWSEVWPQLQRVCEGKIVLTFNVVFDWFAITNTCEAAGIERPELGRDFFCLMEFYSEYYGEYSYRYRRYRWQSLPWGDHSALGDSLAALRLLKYLANAGNPYTFGWDSTD